MCSTENSQENNDMLTVLKKYYIFVIKFSQTRTLEMMREMEKVFETLKEEFNRKISSDSFISYFVKHNNVSEGSSCSDSFEDISMNNDVPATSTSEKYSDNEDLIQIKTRHEDVVIEDTKEDITDDLVSEEIKEDITDDLVSEDIKDDITDDLVLEDIKEDVLDNIVSDHVNEDVTNDFVTEDLVTENLVTKDHVKEDVFNVNNNDLNENSYFTLTQIQNTDDCKTKEKTEIISIKESCNSKEVRQSSKEDVVNETKKEFKDIEIENKSQDDNQKEETTNNLDIYEQLKNEEDILRHHQVLLVNEYDKDSSRLLELDENLSIENISNEENNFTPEVIGKEDKNKCPQLDICLFNTVESKNDINEKNNIIKEKQMLEDNLPCVSRTDQDEDILNDNIYEYQREDLHHSILMRISEGSDDQLVSQKSHENKKDESSEVFIKDIINDIVLGFQLVETRHENVANKKSEDISNKIIFENTHKYPSDHHVTFKSESEIYEPLQVVNMTDISSKELKNKDNEDLNLKNDVFEGLVEISPNMTQGDIVSLKNMDEFLNLEIIELIEKNKHKEFETSEESENRGDINYIVSTLECPSTIEMENKDRKEEIVKIENIRPTKIKRNQDGSSAQRLTKKQSLHRMMWSEMPEVIESGILEGLPKKQIQLQEAMFEIITSEASYYQNLMILTTHFFDSDLFKKDSLASSMEKHHIFSNVILIMSTSQKFLNDLEKRWLDEKPKLSQICDIILKHSSGDDFQNYVTYLRNQEYQSKALKHLSENEIFKQQLNKLENSSVCGKLSMDSYLMLPMQRLTRLKLLVDAILKVMYCEELRDFITEEHINIAEMSLEQLKKLLDDSDFQKGFMDQKTTLMLLMNKLDFPINFKRITISNKVFIKEDELRLHQQNPVKNVKKISKKRQPVISFILFNDLLILAKKKGLKFLVIDYCERINIEATETKYKAIVSSADVSDIPSSVDFDDELDELGRVSTHSLSRSKTSLTSDDWKRLSATFTNSLKSMPLINRSDEQEIINNSFSLKFSKSQTDIFSIPIVFLAKNKLDRDEWLALLSNPNLGNNANNFAATDPKLRKTTSLRNNANRKEDYGVNKFQSLYVKRKDDDL